MNPRLLIAKKKPRMMRTKARTMMTAITSRFFIVTDFGGVESRLVW